MTNRGFNKAINEIVCNSETLTGVLQKITIHYYTSKTAQIKLYKMAVEEGNKAIRHALVCSLNCCMSVLEEMLNDENSHIRALARRKIDIRTNGKETKKLKTLDKKTSSEIRRAYKVFPDLNNERPSITPIDFHKARNIFLTRIWAGLKKSDIVPEDEVQRDRLKSIFRTQGIYDIETVKKKITWDEISFLLGVYNDKMGSILSPKDMENPRLYPHTKEGFAKVILGGQLYE